MPIIKSIAVVSSFNHSFTVCTISMYIVPKSVSGVMLSLTSANGGAAINVTWDAPVVNDVVIAHYEVMYVVSEHPSAGGTGTSTATNHIITGLVKGALYSVQVRAVSMEGGHAGAYSAVQSITAPVGEKVSTLYVLLVNSYKCMHHTQSFFHYMCTDVRAPIITMVTPGERSIFRQGHDCTVCELMCAYKSIYVRTLRTYVLTVCVQIFAECNCHNYCESVHIK